jgi:hypothetical protein
MTTKDRGKPVMRVVQVPETEWKWATGWLGELLKSVGMDELNPDVLRLGGFLRLLQGAQRATIEDTKGDQSDSSGKDGSTS